MTQKKFVDAITDLDADIIEKYFTIKNEIKKERGQKKHVRVKWILLATCFILIASAIIVVPVLHEHGSAGWFPSINKPQHNDAAPGIKQTAFEFDTYEEMINAFEKNNSNSDRYTIQEFKSILDKPYSSFVDKVNMDRSFPHPMLNNKPILYRNEEDFSNITFLVYEAYGLPWIWYHPAVSTGENFYIKLTYLPDNFIKTQEKLTASDIIKELSPNSPNVNNLGKQHEKIYNQKIKLYDREVIALVIEYKSDNRNSTIFTYDDLLVEVRCDPKVWGEDWFVALTFDDYNDYN